MRRPWTRSKFGNKKTVIDGHAFSSKLEGAVYQLLKLREKAGELELVKLQGLTYLTRSRILYKPDFECIDNATGRHFWVEAKGAITPVWMIKKRLWKNYGPGRLEVWKGTSVRPILDEIIIPTLDTD